MSKTTTKAPSRVMTVDREEFVAAVTTANRIASSLLPDTTISTAHSKMTVSATDADVAVTSTIPTHGSKAHLTMTLPAKGLADVARHFTDDDIELMFEPASDTDGMSLTLRSGDYVVALVGTTGTAPLERLAMPDVPGAELDADQFLALAAAVVPAASGDTGRPVLTGVFLEDVDGHVTATATDSYRLAHIVTALPGLGKRLLPSRLLREAAALTRAAKTDTVTVHVTEDRFGFVTAGHVLVGRLIDGEYPTWRALLPTERNHRVTVDRAELAEAVRRVTPLVDDACGVRLTIGATEIAVTATSHDVGKADDKVAATVEGDAVTVALNPKYLLDALAAVTTTVATIDVVDALKPVVVSGEDGRDSQFTLLMPLRIS